MAAFFLAMKFDHRACGRYTKKGEPPLAYPDTITVRGAESPSRRLTRRASVESEDQKEWV